MIDQRIAPQVEYKTLEEFIERSNNFYLFFLPDCWTAQECYRKKEAFLRFQQSNPEMDKEISGATMHAVRVAPEKPDLPWEKLFEAYKKMSQLVFVDDEWVMRDGKPDDWYLCR
jgi:hypothetical protein